MTLETALALATTGRRRTRDACAGATSVLAAVAAGVGGHGTGWIPARLAVRHLCTRPGHDEHDLDVALALVRPSS